MKSPLIRVLLVDDDESFAAVIADGLHEEFGFEITKVYSGKEAIVHLKTNRQGFDVMILDFMMPEMSGLEVLRWMHEDRNETPAIMLTAAGSEKVAVEAMKLGAYDYVRKELTDLYHLANLIKATHERHLFRVARAFEEEQAKEMVLNKEATDKVRDVINAITPTLNTAFANISADLDSRCQELLASLPPQARKELVQIMLDVQTQSRRLEAGVRGLLALYQLTYARHPEAKEIDHIRREFEERTKHESST